MLDNVSMSIDLGSPIIIPVDSRERIIFGNLELAGILNSKDFETYSYKRKEKNIEFTLCNQTLRINNSLHKFFAGENYSDFTFKQLEDAVNEIEYLTQIHSNNIKIHTCELALNIETELPGKDYLRMFGLYNFQQASNMMSGKTVYGIKYVFTEYSIKIYDKTEHYKKVYSKQLPKNILRFEIEYKKSRRLFGLNTLADVSNKMKIEYAFRDYFNILKKLKCIQLVNGASLDKNEMALYYAGKNQDYWDMERLRRKESFKYLKKLYALAVNKANETDLMPTFLKLLEDKYEVLLNS